MVGEAHKFALSSRTPSSPRTSSTNPTLVSWKTKAKDSSTKGYVGIWNRLLLLTGSTNPLPLTMPDMNRATFIFLIIFFTFILPGPPASPISSDEQYAKLQLFKQHLYSSYYHLGNLTYSETWSNLTGFMLSYDDVLHGTVNQTYPLPGKDYKHWANNQKYSILPDGVTQEAERIWFLEQNEQLPYQNYYPNISASLRGEFNLVNNSYTSLPLQLPSYLDNFNEDLQIPSSETKLKLNKVGNITTEKGIINMEVTILDKLNKKYFNKLDSKIKLINVDFEVSDFDEGEKHTIETKGFYFLESGNIITTTNSAKFHSFYGGIQHLTLNKDNFDLSQNLTIEYLQNTFFKSDQLDSNLDINFNYLTQFLENSEGRCEYLSYFHLNKVNLTKDQINAIDQEFQNPIGRPLDFSHIPDLNLTGVLYSPDCTVQLQVPIVVGPKREITIVRFHKVVILGMLVIFTQIFLLMKQMNHSSTPSTISRISFWSIGLMSLVDGSLAMLYLVSSAILSELYLPLTVSAFLSFILASIFEMRFMISIYASQQNEQNISIFTALQGRPLDEREETTTTNNEPMDESQVSGAIYTRFFFLLIAFTFVVLNSLMWPRHPRLIFEYVVLFALNSYWLPQAYRNVIKGSHRSFKWWFIIGTTITRSVPIFYAFCFKDNVFHHHYDPKYFLIILFWLSTQIGLLFLQELLGARFFLPKRFLPETYNYHPILTESDLESGFGITHNHTHTSVSNDETQPLTEDGSPSIKTHDGHHTIDCAICMNEVELPVLKSNLDQAATFLARRAYMVTPCRHIFHSGCLEAWMKYKLQCPVCRSPLPPL